MRLLLAALIAFVISPAFAYDTPEALVTALYAPYMPGGVQADAAPLRSADLQKLYDSEAARIAAGDGGAFDFDPLLDAQDTEITNFAMTLGPDFNEFAADVDVTFNNFGEPVALKLILFNYDGEWKLEDVSSEMAGNAYLLTDLLSPKITFGDETYADPKSVVDTLYSPYKVAYDQFEWRRWNEAQLYSTGLEALFEADRVEADGEIGRIDFDPFINGQDYDITELSIGDATITGDTASVPVAFKNFGNSNDISIYLSRENGRWKIDDMENRNDDYPYRLRAILEAPLEY